MQAFYFEAQQHTCFFGRTPIWRFLAAGQRAAGAFIVAGLLCVVIYLPTALFGVESAAPLETIFGGASVFGLLMAFVFGLSRLASSERWILDLDARVLILERYAFGRARPQEALDLDYIVRWSVERALGGHRMKIWLQAGDADVTSMDVLSVRGKGPEITALLEQIKAFAVTHRANIPF